MADVELFDATAFATSEAEALLMDPQQRVLLEVAGEVLLLHCSRPDMEPLSRRDIGAYVGLSSVDYLKVGSMPFSCRAVVQNTMTWESRHRPHGRLLKRAPRFARFSLCS